MGFLKIIENPIATKAFWLLPICGNTQYEHYGSRLFILNERQFNTLGPMGEAKCVPGAKQASKRRLEKSTGREERPRC